MGVGGIINQVPNRGSSRKSGSGDERCCARMRPPRPAVQRGGVELLRAAEVVGGVAELVVVEGAQLGVAALLVERGDAGLRLG
jgi:hypothetical protein